jgi:hypothetical protein
LRGTQKGKEVEYLAREEDLTGRKDKKKEELRRRERGGEQKPYGKGACELAGIYRVVRWQLHTPYGCFVHGASGNYDDGCTRGTKLRLEH